MTPQRQDPALDHIAEEAADWFARLHNPVSDASARADFADWLRRSPLHVQEYLAAVRVWGELTPEATGEFTADELISAARRDVEPRNVIGLRAIWGRSRAEVRRGTARWRWATVTALIGASLLVGVFLWTQRTQGDRYVTVSGETKTIRLTDGSNLHLNGNSSATVLMRPTERRVALLQGEALFDVAHDAQRPFLVLTARATVRAVGTVFNVQASSSRTAVTVLEGRVEIVGDMQTPAPSTGTHSAQAQRAINATPRIQLEAGQRAAVTDTGQVLEGAGPSTEEVRAWSQRRLVFREESLADVVVEFNRYNERPIELDDPALAAVRISGTFDANDPESLIEYLERYEGLRADETTGKSIKLRPHQRGASAAHE
jgi:transmembrane sensor